MKIRFYTLLGVDTPAAAVAKWPADLLRPFLGDPQGDPGPFEDLMIHLQDSLEFRSIRPGADPDSVGLSGELFVEPSPIPVPLVMAQLTELAFLLKPTGHVPAMLYVTRGRRGLEVMVQGLPVEIQFPAGMIQPLLTQSELEAADFDPPDRCLTSETAPFDPDHPDSVEVFASYSGPTRVSVRVNVRLTGTGEFLFDTVVPISIGPCRFSGLPCRGLHDIQITPNPLPTHVDRHHRAPEIALEWTRRDISIPDTDAWTPGLISIRTIDFDERVEPFKGMFATILSQRPEADPIELAVEDVVLPFRTAPPLPIPTHGRISLRRRLVRLNDAAVEAYDLHSAPIEFTVRKTLFKIFRAMLQVPPPGEIPFAFDVAWTDAEATGSDAEPTPPKSLTVTEQGELLFGYLRENPGTLVRILGIAVKLSAIKIGVSPREMFKGVDADFLSVFALLGDFMLLTSEQAESSIFELRDETGQPTARIVHDFGWKFGGFSAGSFYDPTKLHLVVADRVRLDIDELGLVGDDNGDMYLMVSASLLTPLGEAGKPDPAASSDTNATASTDDSTRKGFGFRLHRLRLRIGSAGDNTRRWKLDGASLFIRKGQFELTGFGMFSEYDRPPGNHYKECALELKARLKLGSKRLDFGGQFFHGSVRGVDNFTYLLIGFSVGQIPLGATRLLDVQLLLADDMMPRLDPPAGQGESMRLLRWFKANGNALSLPLDRKITAWAPANNALAFGVGLTLTPAATSAVRFEGFFFYHKSPAERGLLIGFEVYFSKAPKPIAFAAAEWDFERDSWSLMIGIALGLDNVLGEQLPSFLSDLAVLTGSLYYARNPDILAIGQYNDQSTWLQIAFQFGGEKLNFGVFAGFCRHRADEADPAEPTRERINVWAFMLTVKGGGKVKCLARLQAYATAVLVVGQWRNEGMATGHQFLFEIGIRCKVFGCFNFGAHVKMDTAALGPGVPAYHRKSTTFRIETPWYLPDVTFRWESTEGTAVPEAMELVSMPMGSASARRPVGPREVVSIGVTSLDGTPGAGPVYELRRLRDAIPHDPTDAEFAALRPLGVDCELMLDLAASCDAAATVLTSTTDTGGGAQDSGQLTARYEIVEVGIRRRRRFGDGSWHDLIEPFSTNLESLEGLTQQEIEARFHPAVRFDWDPDLHRVGRVDPRRLVVNADTPYSFFTSNPESDEVIVSSQPGWPCCRPPRRPVVWHVVEFHDTLVGLRTPAVERFTQSASTLHWIGGPPPVVVPPIHAPAGRNVVGLRVGERVESVIAAATFDEPVAVCQVFAYWAAVHSTARVAVEVYNGLALVESRLFDLSTAAPVAPFVFTAAHGVTSLLIRKVGGFEAPSFDPGPAVELLMVRYRTRRELVQETTDRYRCGAQNDQLVGGGRLAWLPNTDYEVTIKTRVTLGYPATGEQDGTVVQKAYFRTKGLVGLNATARVGEEVDPYVESTYPAAGDYLYRREALAVAFNEKFNTLVPVDRIISPTDPEERQQLLEWVVALERVGGADGLERISQTSPDWVVEHRPAGPPPLPGRRPALIGADIFSTPTRQARTMDPYRIRFENMMSRPDGCAAPPALHASQVLVHQPVDPGAPDAAVPRWEPDREYRVNLRQKNGPFVERLRFDPADAGAFIRQAESGFPVPWTSADGNMRPATVPGNVGQLALFGDPSCWERLQVRTVVDPEGAQAGLAVAVSGPAAAQGIYALVDETGPEPRLRLLERRNGIETEVASATIPADEAKPYTLEVISYDDKVRASVGDVAVEPPGDRGDLRTGRPALVARGGGAFHQLAASALDAWRCHFRSSRFDDFEAHIGSFSGTLGVLEPGVAGPPASTVAGVLLLDSDRLQAAMTAGADSEDRERLFVAWVEALALPLREQPTSFAITRVVVAGTTHALLVESPEPLPFSRDVSLLVKRRLTSFPWPPPHPPFDDLAVFLANIEEEDGVLVAPPVPRRLMGLRKIVRAESTRRGIVHHVYSVTQRKDGAVLTARVHRVHAGAHEFESIAPDEMGFFDARGQQLLPPIASPSPQHYVAVAARILSNGDERRALVIPVGTTPESHAAMPAGTYRLIFSVDRPRWRAATPDDTTNYRSSHMLVVAW